MYSGQTTVKKVCSKISKTESVEARTPHLIKAIRDITLAVTKAQEVVWYLQSPSDLTAVMRRIERDTHVHEHPQR
jgi:hypothetical protein